MTKQPEDFSEQELKQLLIEKRRIARRKRIERFRRTGRAEFLTPDLSTASLGKWQIQAPEKDDEGAEKQGQPSLRRRWFDRVLLAVEILAILGLVAVLVNSFGLMRTLNTELAAAFLQNTPSATPLISAIILPGGHIPPSGDKSAQENLAEIPVHLLPLVQSYNDLPIPTTAPGQALRIQIPAIGVDAPIVQGDNWEQLKKGVGQHLGTGTPGELGNVVLSAHNDFAGEIFRHLDDLVPGDPIILMTAAQQFTYIVTNSLIVDPLQVEVMAPTPTATVTLISCYPYLIDTKRIVIIGLLQTP